MAGTVLLVEDEHSIATLVRSYLDREGHQVVWVRSGEEALTEVSREEVPRAFERFFLYDRHRGERTVGTGLGLAIGKELTEAMGGTVGVRSAPGQGTTFTVRLPAAPVDVRTSPPTPKPVSA